MGRSKISCPSIGVWKCKDAGMVILPRDMTETSRVEPLYAGSDRDMTLGVQTWAAPPTHTYTNGRSRITPSESCLRHRRTVMAPV